MLNISISKYVIGFVGAMGASAIIVPALIWCGQRYGILSRVDFRRKNQKRIPLMGGVSIYFSFLIATILLDSKYGMTLALCGLPIAIVGILDDIFELPSQPKFIAQFITIALWIGITPTNGLLLEQIGMTRTMAFLFTGFWMIGIINAMNFIDGMDGEATMTSIIILFTLVILSKGTDESLTAMALTGACIGFALYNFAPAKIYLGDSGSTFLGFATSAITVQLDSPMDNRSFLLVPLFIFAFPEIDACMAIFRRIAAGTSVFKGDHEHLHHKLQKLGFSVNRTLLIISILVGYCCFSGWFIAQLKESYLIWSATFLATAAMLLVMGAVYYIYYRLATQVSAYSKTIMHKYLNINEELVFDPKNFRGVSFDLLAYYKELQTRGLLVVDNFIKSFADYANETIPNGSFKLVGSYTIVCVINKAGDFGTLQDKIAHDFKRLLTQYNIVKTSDEVPHGLEFYSEKMNKNEFINLAAYKTEGTGKNSFTKVS
jgi:UDP-GlcNAc:undecaprenyl-phosphate/decaprenyl-phosphate GlcNAc-1-phosphate transferase